MNASLQNNKFRQIVFKCEIKKKVILDRDQSLYMLKRRVLVDQMPANLSLWEWNANDSV